MNIKGLSFNTIPPLSIPLRFFLTAPLFGILAALMILYHGSDIWISRWNSINLALTHLLTLGFMLMVMTGALYQFIPVMIGQFIPWSKKLAAIIHPLMVTGTITLATAFSGSFSDYTHFLYVLAFISLACAFLLFAVSLMPLLISKLDDHLIVFLLRILFIVLLLTIALGLYMLLAYSYPRLGINFRAYTDIHALWGLIGWTVLLILAVSSQVIPMFYVTPEFSRRYLKLVSVFILITLFAISFVTSPYFSSFTNLSGKYVLLLKNTIYIVLSLELIFFSLYTLRLIGQRKRKLADATINFFRLALISLVASVIIWWFFSAGFNKQYSPSGIQFEFTLSLLLIYGLAISAIIGLLQKIVPFLIYLHLQNLSIARPGSITLVPNMKKVISTNTAKIQFLFHLLSLVLLIISVYFPLMTWLAGLVMLGNFSWLWNSLLKGFLIYKNNKAQILAYPEVRFKF